MSTIRCYSKRFFKTLHGRFLSLSFILILSSGNLIAQENSFKWNDLVAWIDVTHWTKYMIISLDYFSPTALPGPELKSALIEEKPFSESNLYEHISSGIKYYPTI